MDSEQEILERVIFQKTGMTADAIREIPLDEISELFERRRVAIDLEFHQKMVAMHEGFIRKYEKRRRESMSLMGFGCFLCITSAAAEWLVSGKFFWIGIVVFLPLCIVPLAFLAIGHTRIIRRYRAEIAIHREAVELSAGILRGQDDIRAGRLHDHDDVERELG